MSRAQFSPAILLAAFGTSVFAQGAPNITTTSLPPGAIGEAYNQTLQATGGKQPYTWSVASGSLPAGLHLSQAGSLTGTPSAAGSATFTVAVKDASNMSDTQALSLSIAAALSITATTLPHGTVSSAYNQQLAAAGGTPPYQWSMSSGTLPQGLSLSSAGVIAGTLSAAGTSNFTVQVQDSGGATAKQALSITVDPVPLAITTSALPSGAAGTAYSQTLVASGGAGGYTWAISAGSLPGGLSLSGAGVISGTPSAAGNASFTVQVQDSAGTKATKQLSITINPAALTITTSTLPAGMVSAAYSQTMTASGGTGGYTWSVSAGSLPGGLSLSGAGVISGTPLTAGTASVTVQVQDSSGTTATKQLSITINPPPLTITTSTLAPGSIGTAYSQTLAASGGIGGYTWTLAGGALPAGLALNAGGVVSGTPTTTGTSNFTAQVQDSSGTKATRQLSITVTSAISIVSPATLPNGAVGVAYTATLAAAGGVSPYTWTLASGQLPPGLTLNANGSIGGTPTSAGGFAFVVTATDSSGAHATGQAGISIRGSLAISTPSNLASGAVGSPYTQGLTASGGTAPYTWTLTSGTLPSGLSLGTGTGIVSGTPTQAGTFQVGVQVADASTATASGTFSIAIVNGMVIATAPLLPPATVGTAYNLAIGAEGGTAPYQWSITAGTLPAGLSFTAAGQISGTPTSAGSFTFTAQAADAAGRTVTKNFSLTVAPALTITTTTALPGAATGAAYRQALAATGGTGPYVWLVSAGSLPAGVALDASTGILSGTPSAAGTFNFTVTVTDSNSVTAQQAFNIAVGQGLTVTSPAALPDGTAGAAYNFTLSAAGGRAPYTWIVTQGALPAGLTLDPSSGTIAGVPSAGGAFAFTVQVTDAAGLTVTRPQTLAIDLPTPGALQIGGLASTLSSAQQPLIDVALAQPFPVPITGVLNLTFTPAANAPDDPAVQFSTGGRSATFTIPAGAAHATFPASQFAIQTGSVAGTISIAATSIEASGAPLTVPGDMTASAQIAPAAPAIRTVSLTSTSGGFQVSAVGMSNTRELTQATITFQPAAGSSFQTGNLVVPLGDAAKTWFQGTASAPYGGQFTLTIPFTVNGGGTVRSVSVVLSNTVGDSSAAGSQ